MSRKIQNILIVLVFLTGIGVMAYPSASSWYNKLMGSQVVSSYKETVKLVDESKFAEMFAEAREFNDMLTGQIQVYPVGSQLDIAYRNSLDVLNGMMGYLVIDKININLPIYHGTSESVLQKAVGHLEGSHLPTGDIGNSTVLTGHTGLPSADLLTNLTKLGIGDVFEISVLNEVFTYEVFEINVVEPHEVEDLRPISDIDMATLVTCTPYGINSHRLLVHGMQIETPEIIEPVLPDVGTQQVAEFNYFYIAIAFVSILMVIIVTSILRKIKKNKADIHIKKSGKIEKVEKKPVEVKNSEVKTSKPIKVKKGVNKSAPNAEDFLNRLDIMDSINEVCDSNKNVDE